jgi:hypothetical protein
VQEPRFKILVLYCLDPQRSKLAFLKELIFFLRASAPEHDYIYHNARFDSPRAIRHIQFDAIILDVTFLALRWNEETEFRRILEEYSFVSRSEAVKIALPQDEYDCNEILDDWFVEWQIDTVFSVIAENHHILYPKYHKIGRIELGYTGYVPESLIARNAPAYHQRPIDIGYRAQKLPAYFGRIGFTKWKIGELVAAKARNYNLNCDIVIGPEGTLYGEDWYDFIARCKFTLGANSGSSLLDPRGTIQRRIRAYLKTHDNATYEELEELFFPGLDGRNTFTALSPRVIEAALLRSCQILVRGHYSGVLEPWVHYIPIEPDASDFEKVYAFMQQTEKVLEMTERCRAKILSIPQLRFGFKAQRILDIIRKCRPTPENSRTTALSWGTAFYRRRKKLEFSESSFMRNVEFNFLRLLNKLGWTV